jgi:hypothetical protein
MARTGKALPTVLRIGDFVIRGAPSDVLIVTVQDVLRRHAFTKCDKGPTECQFGSNFATFKTRVRRPRSGSHRVRFFLE